MISTPCDIVYPIDSHSRPPNISSIRAERAHDSSTPRSNGCVAKHLSDWVRSPWETTTLSIVFDARKNAEQSKRAREAIAGTPQLPELAPHSSDPRDTAPANAWAPSVDIAKGTIPQQAPIVRSLLRMPRSERRATTPHTSNVVREASRIEPTTLVLREDPIYPAIAKQQLISGSVEVHFRISPEGKVYDVKSVKGSPMLARAAVEAVATWRYEPARLNGAPIDSQGSTNFDFKLD
jgi:TonB family protein